MVPSQEQASSAVVTPGQVTIAASGIRSEEKLGSAALQGLIVASGIQSQEKVGSATATPSAVTISVYGILSQETIGSLNINELPLVPPPPTIVLHLPKKTVSEVGSHAIDYVNGKKKADLGNRIVDDQTNAVVSSVRG